MLREADRGTGVLCAGLAVFLVAVAFLAGGGTDLAPNTWVQVGLLALAGCCGIAVVLVGTRAPAWGAGAVGLFVVLAVLSYASIFWSVIPSNSWVEANRTLSYFTAFAAAAVLGRLLPGRARALVGAVALCATAVAAYALLAKVFPAALDRNDPLGRLSTPLGYWNALGLMAAVGIPPCLWLAARPGGARWLQVLSPSAISVLVAALLLSYSRGALAVAVIGTVLWFVLVPLRLRGAAILAVGLAGAAAIAVWALPRHPLTADYVAMHARVAAGRSFGIVLAIVIVAVGALGAMVAAAVERGGLTASTRRRIGASLLATLALVPLAGLVALAESSRGFTGEVSHLWSSLTSSSGGVGDKPGRLVDLSNSRVRYWREGLKVGEHHLLLGSGAGGFSVAEQRYGVERFPIRHAHNYLIETFADLGLLGVATSLALLVAWGLASARTLGLRRRAADGGADGDRDGSRGVLLTLLIVVVTFGLHSLIDWTWFIPGTAVLALVCAGWLAGEGPPGTTVGRLGKRRSLLRSPGAALAILGVAAFVAVAAWGVLGPLRSYDAYAAAIGAMARGDSAAALADAQASRAEDPVSLDSLDLLSEIYSARGQARLAREELVHATSVAPENPSSWQALATYDLDHRHRLLAVHELHRALVLAPASEETRMLLSQAEA